MKEQMLEEMLQTVRKVRRMMRPKRSVGRCHPAEYVTLAEIGAYAQVHPEEPGVGVGDLAQRLEVSMPAVSRMLGKLEERTLVMRQFEEGNRRSVYVQLTSAGQEILEEAAQEERRSMARMMEALGADDTAHFLRIMKKLANMEVDEC